MPIEITPAPPGINAENMLNDEYPLGVENWENQRLGTVRWDNPELHDRVQFVITELNRHLGVTDFRVSAWFDSTIASPGAEPFRSETKFTLFSETAAVVFDGSVYQLMKGAFGPYHIVAGALTVGKDAWTPPSQSLPAISTYPGFAARNNSSKPSPIGAVWADHLYAKQGRAIFRDNLKFEDRSYEFERFYEFTDGTYRRSYRAIASTGPTGLKVYQPETFWERTHRK